MEKSLEESVEKLVNIPITKHFISAYARGASMDDTQAARAFFAYESNEQVRRFRNELSLIKNGRVSEQVLANTIGQRRIELFHSWPGWADTVLAWLK